MILELFILFFAIAIITIALGYAMKMDALRILGATILFLIGNVFLFGDLQVPSATVASVVNGTTTITTQYATYTNHTLAFFFSLIGIVLLIFVMVDRYNNR